MSYSLIFDDKSKANTEIRKQNIKTLRGLKFYEGGTESQSGKMYLIEMKTKTSIRFGMSCNIGGKQRKYFTLQKDFKNKEEAESFFSSIKEKLVVNE